MGETSPATGSLDTSLDFAIPGFDTGNVGVQMSPIVSDDFNTDDHLGTQFLDAMVPDDYG